MQGSQLEQVKGVQFLLMLIFSFFSLVSPADGAITYVGRVQGSHLEQVKGVRYSLKLFFGNLNDILASVDTRKEMQLTSRLSFNDTFESGGT